MFKENRFGPKMEPCENPQERLHAQINENLTAETGLFIKNGQILLYSFIGSSKPVCFIFQTVTFNKS